MCSAAQIGAVGLSEAPSATVAEVWQESGPSAITAIKDRPMGGVNVLSSVNWDLHVRVADSGSAENRETVGVLHLGLKDVDGLREDEVVSMELPHDKLAEMFLNLETIQEQLDSLA